MQVRAYSIAPIPSNEQRRLAALRSYKILDTEFDPTLDGLAQLASHICETPISLVSLVDEKRQWFKIHRGIAVQETSRDISFCSHAILESKTFVVEDALKDPRFSGNPMVTDGENIRFYCGAQLATQDGYNLGTLCVVDHKPKKLRQDQITSLELLAKQAMVTIEKSRLQLQSKEREVFLSNIVGLLPDLVSYLDVEFNYRYINPAYEKWFHVPHERIIGKHMPEVIGKEVFSLIRPYLLKTIEGNAQDFEIAVPLREYDLVVTKDIRVKYDPDFAEDGSVKGIFVTVRDISKIQEDEVKRLTKGKHLREAFEELKKAQMDLEESQKYQRKILQHVLSMIYVKDAQKSMKYTLVNAAAERMFGLAEADILGKDDFALYPKELAAQISASDQEVFQNKVVVKIEKDEVNTDQGKRYFTRYKVPTYDENGLPHLLIGISRDITAEVNAKEALENERLKSIHSSKLASLGEISAGVAHEINNPLTIIAGAASLLDSVRDNPEKFQAKLKSILRSVDRISKIVKGLKKFSRYSDEIIFEELALSKMVKEALEVTETKARYHSIAIKSEIESDGLIFCNEIEIEQVIINLINNAIDAIKDQSEKWIRIVIRQINQELVLQIVDAGHGLRPEVEAKLFQPFFTTKPVGEGTGLGLSITKGILDQHKASISINHEFENTCFEIRFPMVSHG